MQQLETEQSFQVHNSSLKSGQSNKMHTKLKNFITEKGTPIFSGSSPTVGKQKYSKEKGVYKSPHSVKLVFSSTVSFATSHGRLCFRPLSTQLQLIFIHLHTYIYIYISCSQSSSMAGCQLLFVSFFLFSPTVFRTNCPRTRGFCSASVFLLWYLTWRGTIKRKKISPSLKNIQERRVNYRGNFQL